MREGGRQRRRGRINSYSNLHKTFRIDSNSSKTKPKLSHTSKVMWLKYLLDPTQYITVCTHSTYYWLPHSRKCSHSRQQDTLTISTKLMNGVIVLRV